MLVHHVLEYAARSAPHVDALVIGDRRWRFAELADDVARAATGLRELVEPGARVAVVSENNAEFVMALSAVPRAGGILTFANTRHTPDEIRSTIKRSGATVVIGSSNQLNRLGTEPIERVAEWIVFDDEFDVPRPVHAWSTVVADQAGPGHDGDADDPAWLLYTSGTTGTPKGAVITHRSLLAAIVNTTIARPVADDDVYLFPFPLFHIAAFNVVHHHLRRRPVVVVPKFDAVEVMQAIETERVTSISLAPTMVAMLIDHPDRDSFDLSSLRQIAYGASAMPLDLMRRCLDTFPAGLAQGYGMTELSGNAVFLGPEEHRRAAASEPHLLAAAGRPAPLASIKIVDDADHEVSVGAAGEILVRGDQIAPRYWDDPEETDAAWSGEWFRTGDIGRLDTEGYLYVVDRKKDLIITGGENVSSREVEDIVGTHPAIAQVAVVGLPDDQWGERVVAFAVAADPDEGVDNDAVVAWTEGRLAGFKRPRQVIEVEALPTNASGKIEKAVLRSGTW